MITPNRWHSCANATAVSEERLGERFAATDLFEPFSPPCALYRAMRAGASGFLLKDTSLSRLLDGIMVAAAGEALLAPTVTRRLIHRFTAFAVRKCSTIADSSATEPPAPDDNPP